MEGYLEKANSSDAIAQRETIFEGLADQPYAVDEWGAMLRAAPTDRRDVPELVKGYAKALLLAGKANETLAAIRDRETQGVANQKDRLLWLALQTTGQNTSQGKAAKPGHLAAWL